MSKSTELFKRLSDEQLKLSGKIILQSPFKSAREVSTIAGIDVHVHSDGRISAACAVLSLPGLSIIEKVMITEKTGDVLLNDPEYLSFMEVPVSLKVIQKLKSVPDVFLCGGQGISHPRRLGFAAHLGIALNKSSIGCAQTHAYGEYTDPPPGVAGAYQFLKDTDGDILGIVLRTKPFTRPVFVSPGHLMDVETAGDIVLLCSKYRIPEPLRAARLLHRSGATKKRSRGGIE
jgi:deoxyribonuclease V